MKFLPYFFIIFLISCLFVSNSANAFISDKPITLFDKEGEIINTKGNYLVKGEEFLLFSNERIIDINYSRGNTSFMDRKTISSVMVLKVYDGATLTIKNNNGTTLFKGKILESNFANFFKYGAGSYINNNWVLSPIAILFAALFQGTHKLYYRKRVV